MKSITVQELIDWRNTGKAHQLIDVREDHEVEEHAIPGSVHIKMGEILDRLDEVQKDVDVVIQCRSGARSGAVVQELERSGFDNVHNLTGGILAWMAENA